MEAEIQYGEDFQELLTMLQKDRGFDLFREALEAENLEEFAAMATFLTLEQGERVINQGETGHNFYIVLDGQLRVIDLSYETPHLLNYHGKGDMIGMRALLRNTVRAATVEVVESSRLAVFDEDAWYWLLSKNSRFETYFENLETSRVEQSEKDFPGRQWDEVVVLATKRHSIALIATLPFPLFLLVAPILFFLCAALFEIQFITNVSLILALLITIPFIVISVLLILYNYFDWRNDDFIVTTKRVIHIERLLFFGEQRKDAPLTRIQDVTVISDVLDLIFQADTLTIQTAGVGTITFSHIRRANEMREVIFTERARASGRGAAADVSALRQNIAQQMDLDSNLEEQVMPLAEAEVSLLHQPPTTQHYNRFLDYFIPRIKEVNDTGDGTVIIWRKHYYVLLIGIILPTIVLLGSAFLLGASILLWQPFTFLAVWPIQFALGVAMAFSFFFYIVKYDDWSKDVYMVTNTQIIDIEASAFRLRKTRREGTFDSIQAVYSEIPNVLYKLLNLGDVTIETAGTEDTFTFSQVFDPASVNEEIFQRWANYKQKEREADRDATYRQVIVALREYNKLLSNRSSS